MNNNNGKGWAEHYLSSTGEISTDSTQVDENKYFGTLAGEIIIATKQYAQHNKDKKPQRVNHAKIRAGFTEAKFIISPFIPPDLSFGFLKPNAEYKAIVRFSNAGGSDVKADMEPDFRGVSLRIEFNNQKHDFLMTNAERHHATNAREAMVAIMAGVEKDIWEHRIPLNTPLKKLAGLAALIHLKKELKDEKIVHRIVDTLTTQMNRPVESLATETYYSRSPIAIGKVPDPQQSVAVKYRLVPVKPKSDRPKREVDLEEELYNRLSEEDIRFFFQVQTYINPEVTPIENETIVWPNNYQTIAELIIKKENKTKEERKKEMDYVDNLKFNPWNIDPANFLPLGSMNRSRKIVYAMGVKARE